MKKSFKNIISRLFNKCFNHVGKEKPNQDKDSDHTNELVRSHSESFIVTDNEESVTENSVIFCDDKNEESGYCDLDQVNDSPPKNEKPNFYKLLKNHFTLLDKTAQYDPKNDFVAQNANELWKTYYQQRNSYYGVEDQQVHSSENTPNNSNARSSLEAWKLESTLHKPKTVQRDIESISSNLKAMRKSLKAMRDNKREKTEQQTSRTNSPNQQTNLNLTWAKQKTTQLTQHNDTNASRGNQRAKSATKTNSQEPQKLNLTWAKPVKESSSVSKTSYAQPKHNNKENHPKAAAKKHKSKTRRKTTRSSKGATASMNRKWEARMAKIREIRQHTAVLAR